LVIPVEPFVAAPLGLELLFPGPLGLVPMEPLAPELLGAAPGVALLVGRSPVDLAPGAGPGCVPDWPAELSVGARAAGEPVGAELVGDEVAEDELVGAAPASARRIGAELAGVDPLVAPLALLPRAAPFAAEGTALCRPLLRGWVLLDFARFGASVLDPVVVGAPLFEEFPLPPLLPGAGPPFGAILGSRLSGVTPP
jgi:hypothetical protein